MHFLVTSNVTIHSYFQMPIRSFVYRAHSIKLSLVCWLFDQFKRAAKTTHFCKHEALIRSIVRILVKSSNAPSLAHSRNNKGFCFEATFDASASPLRVMTLFSFICYESQKSCKNTHDAFPPINVNPPLFPRNKGINDD